LGLELAEGEDIGDLPSDLETLVYGRRLKGFGNFLKNVFLYPLHGMGSFVIFFGTIVFLFTWFSPPAAMLWMGYMALYFFDVITTSSMGRNEPPDWPEYSGLWDWTSAIMMIVAMFSVAFGPIAYYILYLFKSGGVSERSAIIIPALIFWACVYLPMGFFVIADTKNLNSLNPVTILLCVITAPFRYSLACISIAIAVIPQAVIVYAIMSTFSVYAEVLALPTAIYTVMVICRILGLFYEDFR
ncbi:MAG: hypothetical protein ABIH66_12470, partial [bacterium]